MVWPETPQTLGQGGGVQQSDLGIGKHGLEPTPGGGRNTRAKGAGWGHQFCRYLAWILHRNDGGSNRAMVKPRVQAARRMTLLRLYC